jgi:hypothetical protein
MCEKRRKESEGFLRPYSERVNPAKGSLIENKGGGGL